MDKILGLMISAKTWRLLVTSLLISAVGGGVRADGEFLQFDVAHDDRSAVAMVERGRLSYGVTYFRDDAAHRIGASVLYKPISADEGAPITVKIGPSVGWVDEESEDGGAEAGLKVTFDRWVNTNFGGLYFQGEANTIDKALFVIGQAVFFEPRLTLEASYGESVTYSEMSLALAKRLGDGPLSVRAGHRFDAGSWFLGVSINTF